MSGTYDKILGDKAPKTSWEEIIMLREKISVLKVVIEKLVKSQKEFLGPGERFISQDEMDRMWAVLKEVEE